MIEEEKSPSKNEVLCIGKAWQGLWPNTFSPNRLYSSGRGSGV